MYHAEGGYYDLDDVPPQYQWVARRISKELIEIPKHRYSARYGIPNDYGRTREVGIIVYQGRKEPKTFSLYLSRVYKAEPQYDDDGDVSHWNSVYTYDLNVNREDLTDFIVRVKGAF